MTSCIRKKLVDTAPDIPYLSSNNPMAFYSHQQPFWIFHFAGQVNVVDVPNKDLSYQANNYQAGKYGSKTLEYVILLLQRELFPQIILLFEFIKDDWMQQYATKMWCCWRIWKAHTVALRNYISTFKKIYAFNNKEQWMTNVCVSL